MTVLGPFLLFKPTGITFLYDIFTTADAAPITSPRPAEPGPGDMTTPTDTGNNLSINGSATLVAAGGASSWGDPGCYWDDSGAFSRATVFEVPFKVTSYGHIAFGLSNSTTLSTANTKNCLYVAANQRWFFRDILDTATATQEEAVALNVEDVQYTLRVYVREGGGCLWLIKGGHWGTNWRTLCYSEAENDASIYPAFVNYSAAFQSESIIGYSADLPPLYEAYWNGKSASVSYRIGRGVSHNGISIGRDIRNPVVSNGTGWEAHHVKDPFVLKDGATYKMWYAGSDASNYQIGYATSSDGISWSKSVSNPVIDLGAASDFDENGCTFPIVYKDVAAPASKRYRMLYNGLNASNKWQIGYAYSADGESWTKGSSNPVVPVGSGGSDDDEAALSGSLVKDGATYYLYYGMRGTTSFPVDDKVGLVTFSDFEGTYTKDAGNPIITNRTGTQALTSDLNAGSTTVSVGDSSGFTVGEYILLFNSSILEHNSIDSIPNGTTIELRAPVSRAFTTAAASKINTSIRAIFPRFAVKEGGTWKLWITPFHNGASGDSTETTAYATSANPDSGWSWDWDVTPPLHLSTEGFENGWDSITAENVVFVLDADTYTRTIVNL